MYENIRVHPLGVEPRYLYTRLTSGLIFTVSDGPPLGPAYPQDTGQMPFEDPAIVYAGRSNK